MSTLDLIEKIAHGTPAGFTAGCRSRGACPNHRSRTQLTCVEANRARHRDFTLSKLDPETPITRAMTRLTPARKERRS